MKLGGGAGCLPGLAVPGGKGVAGEPAGDLVSMRRPRKPKEVANSWVDGGEPGACVENVSAQLNLPDSYRSGEGDVGESK